MEREGEKGEVAEKDNLTFANFNGDSNSNLYLKVIILSTLDIYGRL